MLTTSSVFLFLLPQKPRRTALASFCGVNIPTTADFKLPNISLNVELGREKISPWELVHHWARPGKEVRNQEEKN